MNSFLSKLTPPPFNNPVEYDGLEYRWKFFVFRPALFQLEVYLLGALALYGLWAAIGARRNSVKASKWLDAHLPVFEAQFSAPSVGGLTKDGLSDFFSFSTGRRNVASLHTIFKLLPRHDLVQQVYQFFWGVIDLNYQPVDDLQLDFLLFPGALPHDFVWAAVKKDELRAIKKERWDLTFTKTAENPSFPAQLSVMSEFADITESIIKSTPILGILKNEKNLKYFRSLSVTDQPRERPLTPEREKHVILTLSVPSSPKDTVELVSAIFSFIDSLNKLTLRPETKSKLKKTRDEFEKELKEEAEKERKEELNQAKEDQRAAKKRAEDERIAKLSAAEQQKILEKEKKRAVRRQQGKQAVRK